MQPDLGVDQVDTGGERGGGTISVCKSRAAGPKIGHWSKSAMDVQTLSG